MLTVVHGDWPSGPRAKCVTAFSPRPTEITFQMGFKSEKVSLSLITSAEVITADSGSSTALGYTIAGAALFGVVGALAGANAAKNSQQLMVAVSFKDGRRVVLSGKASELGPILAAGHKWSQAPADLFEDEPPPLENAAEWDEKIDKYKQQVLQLDEKPIPIDKPVVKRNTVTFGRRQS